MNPAAPAQPNPQGVVLGFTRDVGDPDRDFTKAIPDSGTDGRAVSAKNELVYETTDLNGLVGFPSLEAFAAWPPTPLSNTLGAPSSGDSGVLTTRDPRLVGESVAGAKNGNCAHGLPINFGAGRGKWLARDARFFSFEIESKPQGPQPNAKSDVELEAYVFTPDPALTPAGGSAVLGKQVGDYDFIFQNYGSLATLTAGPGADNNFERVNSGGMRLRITHEHSAVR
jgi:hypothetical protein